MKKQFSSVNDPAMVYQWFFNGTAISGVITNTITAVNFIGLMKNTDLRKSLCYKKRI